MLIRGNYRTLKIRIVTFDELVFSCNYLQPKQVRQKQNEAVGAATYLGGGGGRDFKILSFVKIEMLGSTFSIRV